MRVAFTILRSNYYKFFAPIIDESLKRGHQIYCLHDYSQPRDGLKGYNFPHLKSIPSFRHGSTNVLSYDNSENLIHLLSALKIDSVISLETPDQIFSNGIRPKNTIWALLQHGADVFAVNDPETLLNVDLFFCWSNEWVKMGEEFYKRKCPDKVKNGLFEEVKSKIRVVGFPELDSTKMIQKDKIRQELGLGDARPVILYLPLPVNAIYRNYWETNIFPKSRVRQFIEIFKTGHWSFLKHWWNKWNDHELVNSIREFANINDAYFIVKSRKKNPIQDYLEDKSDLNIYDESDYPASILKLLMISDIVISFYRSFTALEAAWCNVPFISFFPIDRNFHDVNNWMKNHVNPEYREAKVSIFTSVDPDSIFNYDGVSQMMEIPYAIDSLRSMNLSSFRIDSHRRISFLKKYLGYAKTSSSCRLLDGINDALKEKARKGT